ncbi:hypothetical protein [uncultured Vagococcus sp.]|uniref:hypothetical protein n=1 Tax=uncultured Vagococcus sp. TaxID=189676 RepID=UPI0028D65697|nr:hypothetical protein [uncultured Vagococcus sp.]
MSFEKTIEELNRLRNEEYERLRYDRSVWDEVICGQSIMIDFAKNDVRSPEELELLEKEKRMIKFYGRSLPELSIEATKGDTAKLVKFYAKEEQSHAEAVEKAKSMYDSRVKSLQEDLQKVLLKHESSLTDVLRDMADLQHVERYVYDSKGLPVNFELGGVVKYHDHFDKDIQSNRILSNPSVNDYGYLVNNYEAFQNIMLNQAKGGK